VQLLDQQAKTAANAAATEQRVKQEQGRTAKHRQHVDAERPKRRTRSISEILRINASPEDLRGSPSLESGRAPGHPDRRS
jgi:hypothetical protein